MEVASKPKRNFAPHRDYSNKSDVKMANFDFRCGFIIKVNDEDEAFQNFEIEHRNAARQTTENIMRIAQNGCVKVVQHVNILIPAELFKVKLASEEMLIKAYLAKNQIEGIDIFSILLRSLGRF